MRSISRREALSGLGVLGFTASDFSRVALAQAPSTAADLSWPQAVTGIGQAFPTGEAFLARELVGAAHNNLDRVKALVSRQPALAKVAWDWGYGDWESALGAASHVGNRPIAEYLLQHGTPPTIFSSAMLGHLDVVKAMVAAQPGLQRVRGPHGIPLQAHASAGGSTAAPVVAFLESLGGANERVATQPTTIEQRAAIAGRYVFGSGARDVLVIDELKDQLGIVRVGATRRNLVHLGDLTFSAIGAEAVRIKIIRAGDRVDGLTIADPDVLVTATRGRE